MAFAHAPGAAHAAAARAPVAVGLDSSQHRWNSLGEWPSGQFSGSRSLTQLHAPPVASAFAPSGQFGRGHSPTGAHSPPGAAPACPKGIAVRPPQVPQAGMASESRHDMTRRISSIGEDLQAALLKHQREAREMQELERHAERMLAELEKKRRSRQVFEQRAQHLQALLAQDRSTTETWLASLKSEMEQVFRNLEVSVDHSLTESGKLMQRRLDEADSMLAKLMRRVDRTFGPRAADAGRAIAARAAEDAALTAHGLPACGASFAAAAERARRADSESVKGTPSAAGADLMQCWTELLDENRRLQQRRNELVSQRQKVVSGRMARSSAWSPHRTASSLAPEGTLRLSRSYGPSPRCYSPAEKPRLPIVQEF